MSPNNPPDPLDLDEVRKRHVNSSRPNKWRDHCSLCDTEWPCDAIRLCEEVERLRGQVRHEFRPHDCMRCKMLEQEQEITRLREALDESILTLESVANINGLSRPVARLANQTARFARDALKEKP